MKRHRLFATALVTITLLGCVNGDTPKQTAEGYLQALAELNFDRASAYVADTGRANFDYIKKLYSNLSAEEQTKFQVKDWKVTGETITGDTATVDFLFDGVKRGQLALEKVRGVWKVDHRQTF